MKKISYWFAGGSFLIICIFVLYTSKSENIEIKSAVFSFHQEDLFSKEDGVIIKCPAEGQKINKGEILFELDKKPLQEKILQKEKSLAFSKDDLSLKNLNRNKAMDSYLVSHLKLSSGKVTKEVMREKLKNLELAESYFQEGSLKNKRLKKELTVLKKRIKNTATYAPFDGVIVKKYVQDNAKKGEKVLTFYKKDSVVLTGFIDEKEKGKILSQKSPVSFPSFSSHIYVGNISIGSPIEKKAFFFKKKLFPLKITFKATKPVIDTVPMSTETSIKANIVIR